MAKYYVSSGSLQLVVSSNLKPYKVAIRCLKDTNNFDILDEYIYVDERGFKNYTSATPNTMVYETKTVLKKANG